MAARQSADPYGAGFQSSAIRQLTAPYEAGARQTTVAIRDDGTFTLDWTLRHPLVLASLNADIDAVSLVLVPRLDPAGANSGLPAATFAPYSEAGSTVILHCPILDVGDSMVPGFEMAVSGKRIAEDGAVTNLAGPELRDLIEIRVLEGNTGRLVYLLGQEKVRLRRLARETQAMRCLEAARRDALDRIGADLGVARFSDELVYDAPSSEVLSRDLVVDGAPGLESDADYAHRLRIFRTYMRATSGRLRDMLNGPGSSGDPNRGLFADIAGGARFEIVEADNPFAVAVFLVSSGGPTFRDNFLAYVRRDRLIWPSGAAAANAIHAARFLPKSRLDKIDALRADLRQSFAFANDAAIAPQLADALDRAGRLCRAVGTNKVWQVARAQDATAGSRYELGLGVDLTPPTNVEATALRTQMLDPNRVPGNDPDSEALVAQAKALTVPSVADDPNLAWFWKLCGLNTVHQVNANTLFLSHLPMFGLVVTGANQVAPTAVLALEARYQAPGDPGGNAVLVQGLAQSAAAWAAQGGAAWTSMTDAQARAKWLTVPARPAAFPAFNVFAGAGWPTTPNPAEAVSALNGIPDELIETIQLDAALAASIVAGQPAAIQRLQDLSNIFSENHIVSVLPFVGPANEVILVLGVVGLPQAGFNLGDRRATGFRWYAVPVGHAHPGQVKAVGSRSSFVPSASGLYAIVVLGYARTGLTDPYEFRVDLPDGAVLTLRQYEYLMNLLGYAYPAGVEVNTYAIRTKRVDLDGDGHAEPLKPAVFRTYRQFRRRRSRGIYDTDIGDS